MKQDEKTGKVTTTIQEVAYYNMFLTEAILELLAHLFFQHFCFFRTVCSLLRNQNRMPRISSLLKSPRLHRSNSRWRSAWGMAPQLNFDSREICLRRMLPRVTEWISTCLKTLK